MVRKGYKQTEDHKKHLSESLKGRVVSEETRNRIRENMKNAPSPCPGAFKGHKHTEEYKKLMSEKHSGKNNPMYGKPSPMLGITMGDDSRKKMSEKAKISSNTIENKLKFSEWSKKLWNDPDYIYIQTIGRRGEKSSAWKGGLSYIPYCYKFNYEFKELIRTKFDRKCFICHKEEKDNSNKKLFVHHIDYDKLDICNGKIWPFVPLCNSCHSKTNHNRWYWFNLLINYWISKYGLSYDMVNL